MRHLAMLVIIVAALHFVSLQPVLACTTTPEGRPSYTLADQVNATALILEGTVTAVSDGSYDQKATVSVQQYLKGDGPSEVIIGNFGSSAMCLTTVSVGDHWIFFASGDPATELRAFYMSAGAAMRVANEESIAAINALLPQESVSDQSQTGPRLPASVRKVMGGLAVIFWMISQ